MKHLQIIDEETGAELADLGMTTRERTRACCDCRFMKSSSGGTFRMCMARGGIHIAIYNLNPHGRCDLWEPNNKITKREQTTVVKTHALVKIWAWTSLVAIVWLLLRGVL